jgi:membrane dipeptidase
MEHRWVDGHLDLAYLAVCGHDIRRDPDDPAARCISLPALRSAGVTLVLATIYTSPRPDEPAGYGGPDDGDGAERAGLEQLEIYERLEREGEVAIVRGPADLARGGTTPKLVLLMEGADPIRSPQHVRRWHERGVRAVGMAWALGTRYAAGNHASQFADQTTGLSGAGRELVAALDEVGMIHDASHLSDRAFEDLLQLTTGPLVASHSNCRTVIDTESQRHLTDAQIGAVAERGGVIGLNLFQRFLASEGDATSRDCLAHVEHVARVAGHRRAVGLGSDMDGGFTPDKLPADLDHPGKLDVLADALADAGWSVDDVAAFRSGNWLRVLRDHLSG